MCCTEVVEKKFASKSWNEQSLWRQLK